MAFKYKFNTFLNYFKEWGIKNIASYLGVVIYKEIARIVKEVVKVEKFPEKIIPWATVQVVMGLVDTQVKPKSILAIKFKDAIVIGAMAKANDELVGELPTVTDLVLSSLVAGKVSETISKYSVGKFVIEETRGKTLPPPPPPPTGKTVTTSTTLGKVEEEVVTPIKFS